MARYDAQCSDCGQVTEYVCSINDRASTPGCPSCGGKTRQVILSAPLGVVKGKFESFKSSVDGSLVHSEHSLREHNARNNVVCLSDGYDEKTISAGAFGNKETKLDKNELALDICESIHTLKQGYKPSVEVPNDNSSKT